jgi:hypothetical protein
MNIPIPKDLRNSRRRADRRRAGAAQALAEMRHGAVLQLAYYRGEPQWSLSSDGRAIPADVADILTHSAAVVPADDTLFPGSPAQTWRHN